jgi:hypothetical protein
MYFLALLLQSQPDPEQVQKIMLAMVAIIPIIILVAIIIVIVPFWFILKKAGMSPWLSLLCLVPSLGILVLLYVLAFAEWKVVPAPHPGWQQPPSYPPPTYPPHA